jgi:hypothetical protein
MRTADVILWHSTRSDVDHVTTAATLFITPRMPHRAGAEPARHGCTASLPLQSPLLRRITHWRLSETGAAGGMAERRRKRAAEAEEWERRKRRKGREGGDVGRRSSRRDPVEVLGEGVMGCVMELLDARSVARCTAVSRAWHGVAADDRLWAPKVRRLSLSPPVFSHSPAPLSLSVAAPMARPPEARSERALAACGLYLFDELPSTGTERHLFLRAINRGPGAHVRRVLSVSNE